MTDTILHAFNQLNNSTFVHIGARWVLYSTIALNGLAFVERILFTFESKIAKWYPQSKIPGRLQKVEYAIEFVTDVLEALGTINFKDAIRPARFNKRSGDNGNARNGVTAPPQDGTLTANQDDAAQSAAAGRK